MQNSSSDTLKKDSEQFTVLAKTFAGLEGVLEAELRELGVENPVQGNRAVTFQCTLPLLYRINLWSRLALRFFRLIDTFEIAKAQDLYDGCSRTSWWKWIGIDQTFRIDNTISSPFFNNPMYASHLAKDAIVDQFWSRFNKRPNVEKENPDFTILLTIKNNDCFIYLDSSGEALFERGYRIRTVVAPINEVLAAGILKITGWTPDQPLIDPMCGSGTFPVEAALMGMNIPPAFNRQWFAFMNWPDFNSIAWRKTREEIFTKQQDVELNIFGYDIAPQNLAIATENITKMRLHKDIRLETVDFFKLKPPVDHGVIVMNPPYGERLRKNNISEFYRDIGDVLKNKFMGFDAWIISSDMEGLKSIALKPHAKYVLFNGKLECKLLGYQLFEGDWRSMKENQ